MTSQPGPHAQFQRGIQTRSVFLAESAARELGRPLALSEALSLLQLYRDDPERYNRAAAIGRYTSATAKASPSATSWLPPLRWPRYETMPATRRPSPR